MKKSVNRDCLGCCVKGTCEISHTMTPGSCSFLYKSLHISSPMSHGRRKSSIFSCSIPWCPLISSLKRKSSAQCSPADLGMDALFAILRILQANLPVGSHSLLFSQHVANKLEHCCYVNAEQFQLYILVTDFMLGRKLNLLTCFFQHCYLWQYSVSKHT